MPSVAIELVALIIFFVTFLALERRGRPVLVVLTVLGVVVLDAVLYVNTEASAVRSIFHPMLLGQSFRLTQLVIPLALLGRLLVYGIPRRIDASAPLWLAFFSWVMVEAVAGLFHGHDAQLVIGQASVIVHVGGGLALAGSVPAYDYVSGTAVPRFVQVSAAVATALFVLDTAGLRFSSSAIPDLPLSGVGAYGADAATLFGSIGVLALVLAVSRGTHPRRRSALLVPGVLLVLSHVASPQRAERLGLYAALLILLLICSSPKARRRFTLRAAPTAVAVASLAAIGLTVAFASVVMEATARPESAAVAPDANVFGATNRQGSIDSRYNQWKVAQEKILEHPVLGEGLGVTAIHYSVGQKSLVESDLTHNIVLDLLRRTGAVGLLLAAASLLMLWAQAVGVWRRHLDDQVAALAIGAVALTGGLLMKGMVESIFEKNRLAVLLGLLLGLAVSVSMSRYAGRGAADEPHGTRAD